MFKYILDVPAIFIFIGSLLFFIDSSASNKKNVLELSASQQTSVIAYEQQKQGRPLTETEVDLALENHIYEEALLQEAYNLGLNNDDFIRKRLLNKMRFVLSAHLPEPNEDDLKTYYQKHQHLFRKPDTINLQQYFLPNSTLTSAEDALQSLLNNTPVSELIHTDRFPQALGNATVAEISSRFGANVAEAANSMELNNWHGPYQSPHGHHFIYVTQRNLGDLTSYDDAKRYIENAWRNERTNDIVRQKAMELTEGYVISLQGKTE